MGISTFAYKHTFEEAVESTEYTVEALDAHTDPKIRALAKPIAEKLEEVPHLRAALSRARRAVTRGAARARASEGLMDDSMEDLGKDVLIAVRLDREHPLYVSVFGDGTARDIRVMTLVPQLAELERILSVVSSKDAPDSLRKTWAPRLRSFVERGHAAVQERDAAAVALEQAQSDAAEWMDSADRARRALYGSLTTYAASTGKGSDYDDRFFPEPPRPPGKKKKGSEPAPPAEQPPKSTSPQ